MSLAAEHWQSPKTKILPVTKSGEVDYSLIEMRLDLELENPQPEGLTYIESLATSVDSRLVELGIFAVMTLLKEGACSNIYSNTQMDHLRDLLSDLMTHSEEAIRYDAQETFFININTMQRIDTVTLNRLGHLLTGEWFD